MAQAVRGDHDLPTLRIFSEVTASRQDAVFQVVRGRDVPTEVARCSQRDLGLPPGTETRRHDQAHVGVPDEVVDRLASAVRELGPSPMQPYDGLWLEFPHPRGLLFALPWERLLLGLPHCLLRLPNHVVRPQAPGERLNVALCVTAPHDADPGHAALRVEELIGSYATLEQHGARVHVFPHATMLPWFRARRSELGQSWVDVTLHDPHEARELWSRRVGDRPQRSTAVTNPWLHWVLDSMDGRSLDIVHFVTHGALAGDRGAVALPVSPVSDDDHELCRLVASVEVTDFLVRTGAWGLVLSDPPSRWGGGAGLRALADAVALVLPGVTLVHDMAADLGSSEFRHALRTVLSHPPDLGRPMPAVTLWTHPRFVAFEPVEQSELNVHPDGSSGFVSEPAREALARDDSSMWVASSSRCLERLQVRWLPSDDDEDADPAAVTALRNVSALLERHVVRSQQTDLTGGVS